MRTKNYMMQKAMLLALFMAFVFGALPVTGYAQDQSDLFAVVDFMKVKQGDEAKYVDLEKTVWKPIHQARIDQGEIIGWVLYGVRYAGANDEYNFVTVALFDDPGKLENTFSLDFSKVHPGKDLDDLFQKTMDSRQLVRQNLIRRVDAVFPEGGPGDFRYIQVNYMKVKPGEGGRYVDNELSVWKPIHQELINAGSRVGWSLWRGLYPFGVNFPYDYVTVDYFADFSKLGAADVGAAFDQAHPGEDMSELFGETGDSRTHVRAELWEVLDSVWKE